MRESFTADPVRDSIEKQVFYKAFNPDAVLMLNPERQAAMLEAYYATGMELISGTALGRAVTAFKEAQKPDEEAS